MKKNKFLCIIIVAVFFMASCDLLDRPHLDNPTDVPEFWQSEMNLRLFAQPFYPQFFVGYNSGWGVDYTPIRGFTFNDDMVRGGAPLHFGAAVPASLGSNATGAVAWQSLWAGPTWHFGWIRRANIMIDRINDHFAPLHSEEMTNHWLAKARFFRALDYCRLVSVFGDVPFFYRDFDPFLDREFMFRDRDSRQYVMSRVYEDFRFALEHLRPRSATHAQELNADVAAAFISRWMLFEGTWQWFHRDYDGDPAYAEKFLRFAVEASEMLMNDPRYSIATPFRQLFGSTGNPTNAEVILWRTYNQPGATHHISSYNNLIENQEFGANLCLIKSFITNTGNVWNATGAVDDDFTLANLIATRDPRFEASFHNELRGNAGGLLYTVKFISRTAIDMSVAGQLNAAAHPQYTSMTNTTAFPVVRLGEVLLNWIEAKAVLQEMGIAGFTVGQAEIDRSINALRARPLDSHAQLRGVQQTAPMTYPVAANFDPSRDPNVSPLMWEIRRERRMELYQEIARLSDIRRWRKLHYMNTQSGMGHPANTNIVRGAWVNVMEDLPGLIFNLDENGNITHPRRNAHFPLTNWTAVPVTVQNAAGELVRFTVTNVVLETVGGVPNVPVSWDDNRYDLVGFFVPNVLGTTGAIQQRNIFTERSYLSPVGLNQINLYEASGFELTQTRNW